MDLSNELPKLNNAGGLQNSISDILTVGTQMAIASIRLLGECLLCDSIVLCSVIAGIPMDCSSWCYRCGVPCSDSGSNMVDVCLVYSNRRSIGRARIRVVTYDRRISNLVF